MAVKLLHEGHCPSIDYNTYRAIAVKRKTRPFIIIIIINLNVCHENDSEGYTPTSDPAPVAKHLHLQHTHALVYTTNTNHINRRNDE